MSAGGAGHPSTSPLDNTTRADLEVTWTEREQEAAHLKAGGHRLMAVVLRCYALEIRLKAIICQHLDLDFLPKVCKTHDLLGLIVFTGLWGELNEPANVGIHRSWDILVRFHKEKVNDLRYQPNSTLTDVDADRIDMALDDSSDGVFSWLSKPR